MSTLSFFVYDDHRVGVWAPDGNAYDVCSLRHAEYESRYMADHAASCIASAAMEPLAIGDELVRVAHSAVIPGTLHAPIPRPRNVFGAPVNYHEHRGELGSVRSSPNGTTRDMGLFVKASGSISGPDDPIELPNFPEREFHYEGEIAVVIGTVAEDVSIREALNYVAGFTGALDLTMRLEQHHREERSMRKSYRTFTPIGPALLPLTNPDQARSLSLRLRLNGEQRQAARLDQLIVSVPELVSLASSIVRLQPGDLILTGTPAGVGPLSIGDVVELEVDGLPPMSLQVRQKHAVPGGIHPAEADHGA